MNEKRDYVPLSSDDAASTETVTRHNDTVTCQVGNCYEPAFCKQLCKRHYWREKDKRRSGRHRDDALIRTRARNRAVARLIDLHPDEFADLFIEEKQAAEAEAEELAAAAVAATSSTSSTRTSNQLPVSRNEHVRLLPGPRPVDQAPADRIRTDVGRCTTCHGHHDRGHRCADCGSAPKEGTG